MSILAVALSQRAHRQHRNKETLKHILVNYKEPPTLDEVKKDPYFKSYKLEQDKCHKYRDFILKIKHAFNRFF